MVTILLDIIVDSLFRSLCSSLTLRVFEYNMVSYMSYCTISFLNEQHNISISKMAGGLPA